MGLQFNTTEHFPDFILLLLLFSQINRWLFMACQSWGVFAQIVAFWVDHFCRLPIVVLQMERWSLLAIETVAKFFKINN
jgi:hypothetical protein